MIEPITIPPPIGNLWLCAGEVFGSFSAAYQHAKALAGWNREVPKK